ncbi:MAG: metallophosphoesterase family protein [Elusimicrobia bacterium]|nr:metallophosphoesterase family protein [Elusimicrobiota bacterium]
MLYGVISDIHGNFEALSAVLKRLKSLGVQEYICCGDITGYGPQPEECISSVMALPGLHCVAGNHDKAVMDSNYCGMFNRDAREVIDFSRKRISAKSAKFIHKLPKKITADNFTIVHGSPRKPFDEYLFSGEQFLENANKWATQICFTGHTHLAMSIIERGAQMPVSSFYRHGGKVLFDNFRAILNPGSVGQPRDKNPQASCAVFDPEKKLFEVFRLDYAFEDVQAMMRKYNLPPMLTERLGKGI